MREADSCLRDSAVFLQDVCVVGFSDAWLNVECTSENVGEDMRTEG